MAPAEIARAHLAQCCGSPAWVERITARRPFQNADGLFAESDRVWWSLDQSDWFEAFAKHPKIGEKRADPWSSEEQRGMQRADQDTAASMEELNRRYQERFGWIFIVCATGKSAGEMLSTLQARLGNEPDHEIQIAASEQAKITKLRLEKLLAS